jgi:UDP-2-acetamido-3-amino-2,3-dideoxy-glucuronate N-acetyltransferase
MMPGGPQIHPAALCESDEIGAGTRVWAFAHVLPGARIGRDCNVCDHVFVEGGVVVGDRVTIKNGVMLFTGVTVEDDVFLGPGVVFTNDRMPRRERPKQPDELQPTVVRQGASLGAGVVVVCGTEIGEYALIGAGAVVVRDVPAHALMVGNPAHRRGWVCTCGERLPATLVCAACGERHRLRSEQAGLATGAVVRSIH